MDINLSKLNEVLAVVRSNIVTKPEEVKKLVIAYFLYFSYLNPGKPALEISYESAGMSCVISIVEECADKIKVQFLFNGGVTVFLSINISDAKEICDIGSNLELCEKLLNDLMVLAS